MHPLSLQRSLCFSARTQGSNTVRLTTNQISSHRQAISTCGDHRGRTAADTCARANHRARPRIGLRSSRLGPSSPRTTVDRPTGRRCAPVASARLWYPPARYASVVDPVTARVYGQTAGCTAPYGADRQLLGHFRARLAAPFRSVGRCKSRAHRRPATAIGRPGVDADVFLGMIGHAPCFYRHQRP